MLLVAEQVSAANHSPTISGQPDTSIKTGKFYVFAPSASDPDGDSLTFSISNKPKWATFYAGKGRLVGTPKAGDAGTYSNIVIRVSDGKTTSSLPAFSIKVIGTSAASNSPPSISGQPRSSIAETEWYLSLIHI